MTGDARLLVDEGGRWFWSDRFVIEELNDATLQSLTWTRSAMMAAVRRIFEAPDDQPFVAWTAAVEGVWWAVALDEALDELICAAAGEISSSGRYRRERDRLPEGEVVRGMRWLRHRHAHEVTITRTDPEFTDFYGRDRGQRGGPPFHFYVPHVWKSVEQIAPSHDRSEEDQPLYDAHFAGRDLRAPILKGRDWFDLVIQASGLSPLEDLSRINEH